MAGQDPTVLSISASLLAAQRATGWCLRPAWSLSPPGPGQLGYWSEHLAGPAAAAVRGEQGAQAEQSIWQQSIPQRSCSRRVMSRMTLVPAVGAAVARAGYRGGHPPPGHDPRGADRGAVLARTRLSRHSSPKGTTAYCYQHDRLARHHAARRGSHASDASAKHASHHLRKRQLRREATPWNRRSPRSDIRAAVMPAATAKRPGKPTQTYQSRYNSQRT